MAVFFAFVGALYRALEIPDPFWRAALAAMVFGALYGWAER
jgi:hypothetical protein